MQKSATGLAAALVLGLFVGGIILSQGVRAQNYPPPVGSLSVTVSSTTPPVGSTTSVTATVLDNAGDPVEGADVTFTIVSQPGVDAWWANGLLETTSSTDATGVATAVLSAGTTAGNIIIETVSGEKTSQVTVAVAQAALPPTGGGPAESASASDGFPAWQMVFIAIGAAALGGGLLVIARRNRKA